MRTLMGLLLYKKVVDRFPLHPQFHSKNATKNVHFQEKTAKTMQRENDRIETNQMQKAALENSFSTSQTEELQPFIRTSNNYSVLQT